MTKFIIRRLIQAIPTFFGITLLSYFIMVLAPGDPVSILTMDPNMTQAQRELLRARLGADDPWPLQYLRWLVGDDWRVVDTVRWFEVQKEDGTVGWISELAARTGEEPDIAQIEIKATRLPLRVEPDDRADTAGRVSKGEVIEVLSETTEQVYGESKGILRGDFGKSFTWKINPLQLIMERLPATFELNVAVMVVSLSLGFTVGVLAAVWRGSVFDQVTRIVAVIGDAVPIFWLGLLLILFFGAPGLDILPMGGRYAPDAGRGGVPLLYERLEYLVLPTITLALGGIAGWSRYMRAAMLENISSDYIRTARAKGLPQRRVWFLHAMRNALIPMATFLGPLFFSLLGGSAITETIFAWPGVGRMLVQAVSGQDYPLVMASVVISAVLTILGYLVSDVLYAVFDPRIRY